MRTMTWILVSGCMALSLGCQRAAEPKVAVEPSHAETPKQYAPIDEPAKPAPAPTQRATETVTETTPATAAALTTAAKTAAAEVEPAQQVAAQSTAAKAETKTETTPAAAPAQPAQAQGGAATSGKLTKAEIINSTQFRRAIFEFNEWLTSQPIYTPQQVAQIKDQFNHRVAEMNAEELTYLLNDLEAKMQLINTPEAREARAWMAQYLSVMSDRKRADVLKDVPNVATMTAAQLSDELSKIQEKRAVMDDQQAAFQKGQAAQVAQQVQTDRINQQNFVRDWNTGPVAYSPYSGNASNVNERLNNTPIGAGMSFYTGGFGGVGVAFSPSAW